ncbi:MAG TPA: MarR family transcriptional regulator [Baekduia sp.]|nr:MarR family transcriptional regulator [Baekduia sp.]
MREQRQKSDSVAAPSPPGGKHAALFTSDPGEFEGFLFWRASLRWQRMMTAALREFKLTHVQCMLLVGAWLMEIENGQTPSQRELAERGATDVMMTSQVLSTLEKRAYITRERDPDDKRIRRVSVTPEGAALAERALVVVAAADEEFFAQVGEPGILLEPLRKLAAWEG